MQQIWDQLQSRFFSLVNLKRTKMVDGSENGHVIYMATISIVLTSSTSYAEMYSEIQNVLNIDLS